MHSISVKELREKFPVVRSELKKGVEFLIIYKSKPIAKLSPVEDLSELEEATEQEIEAVSLSELDDDFLTEEELKYYLSLK